MRRKAMLLAGVSVLLFPAAVSAKAGGPRIGFLHLNRPEGVLEFRVERDDAAQSFAESSVRSSEEFFQERLRGDLSGDVYDERFLTFALGVGSTFSQTRLRGPAEPFSRSQDLQYDGRVDLLSKHPVSSSLAAEQGQSTLQNVFAGRSRLERTQFRGSVSVKKGWMPMTLAYRNTELEGGGFGQPFRQNLQGFSWSGQMSSSESVSLFLTHQLEDFRDLGADTGYRLATFGGLLEGRPGEDQRLFLRADREYRSGSLGLDTWASETGWEYLGRGFQTDVRYGFDQKKTDIQRTTQHRASVHLEHRLYESLTTQGWLDSGWTQERSGRQTTQQGSLQLDYIKQIWGPVRLGAQYQGTVRMNRREFESLLATALDELHPLVDGLPTFLDKLFIDPTSVAVVSLDRVRKFREGTDYSVVPQGDSLEIRRIITGNIVNGESILVSYRYRLGGSMESWDTNRGGRVSLLLGARGGFYVSKRWQDQRITRVDSGIPKPDLENFQLTIYGMDLHWKYLYTSLAWQSRSSNLAPLRTLHSNIKLGGEVLPRTKLITGWSYEHTRYLATDTTSTGRDYFVELSVFPLTDLQFRFEGRTGESETVGTPGRFQSAYGQLAWSFRSLDVEVNNRFTQRWIAASFSRENFLQVRVVRKL